MLKLGISYQMKKGKHETAESYIELPIEEEPFYELQKVAKHDRWLITNPAFAEVTKALKSICQLQGYKLTAYSILDELY